MKLIKLIETLQTILAQDVRRANLECYFDVEGRSYEYHQAKIGSVYCEDAPEMAGLEAVVLCDAEKAGDDE